jgi:hypothetical protein
LRVGHVIQYIAYAASGTAAARRLIQVSDVRQ